MKVIFKNSIKGTFSAKFWNFFGGSISSLLAILLIGKNFLSFDVPNSIYLGLGLVFAIYFVRFIYIFSKQAYIRLYFLYKESIYGDFIIALKDAFAEIHDLRKSETISKEQLKTTLVIVCNQLSGIFERKTKTKCAVSIKVPVDTEVSANTEVINLCRNEKSTDRDTERYYSIKHHIFSNTCFNTIISNYTRERRNRLYYINNNLLVTSDYSNTGTDVYPNGNLPYKAEIVVPILPVKNNGQSTKLIGFICVDSDGTDVFDDKYDLAILQGVADGIYDVILKGLSKN